MNLKAAKDKWLNMCHIKKEGFIVFVLFALIGFVNYGFERTFIICGSIALLWCLITIGDLKGKLKDMNWELYFTKKDESQKNGKKEKA